MPALRIEAVILFERYEQKDNSGKPDLAPWLENAQIIKIKELTHYNSFDIHFYFIGEVFGSCASLTFGINSNNWLGVRSA